MNDDVSDINEDQYVDLSISAVQMLDIPPLNSVSKVWSEQF